MTVSCCCANDLRKHKTVVNIARLTKPSPILIEQDSKSTILNSKRKMFRLQSTIWRTIFWNIHATCIFSETKSASSPKMISSVDNTTMILVKFITNKSFCLDNYSLKVFLQSLHVRAGKHPGISKMMRENRQKKYFPSIALYVRNWVRKSEICLQDKRMNNTRITPDLIHIPLLDLRLEEYMQNDLLPKLPPSGCS